MRTIINNYIRKLKMEKSFRLRLLSVVLCLALVVSVGVFWKLRLTGVSMTSDVVCNIEEHVHDDSCYEQTVICGLEESSEEGGHAHAEACFEKQLACGIEEHAHSIDCISDEEADVETAADWEASLPGKYTGEWATDVLSVAKSQLGYTESVKNFAVDEADNSRKGYTRYGAWYGNLYGDWNTMFMAFCLNYAGVPEEAVPTGSSCYSWISELSNAGLYKEATDYVAKVGDIVFFDTDEDKEADKVGIVSEVTATELISVEGDYENTVAYVTYNTENNEETGIVGVLDLNDAYLAYSEVAEGEELVKAEDAENEAVATDAPLDDASEEAVAEENTEENVDVEATTEAPAEENMDGDTATELPSTDNNDANDSEKEESNEVVETDESVSEAEKAEETEAQDKEEEKEGTNAEEITAEEESDETIFDKFLATFNLVQYFSDEIVASGTWSNWSWELDSEGVLTFNGSGTISDWTYYGWGSYRTSVKKIVISEGVTNIPRSAFENFTSLTEVVIPEGITKIGYEAFYNCPKLIEIDIPSTVTSIGSEAFYNCKALTEVVIPEGVTSIGEYAFSSCSGLTKVTIPESVTSIRKGTFSSCSGLTEVTIPSTVTSIGERAFSSCTSLTEVVIPETVTSIGENAFYGCDSITQVNISENIETIGVSAFCDCDSLAEIIVDENNASYVSVDGVLFNKDKTELICYPSNKQDKSYVIPNTVVSIGSNAFYDCDALTEVEIPSSVTSIGSYAFRNCSSLTKINIPESVTSIGSYAFAESSLVAVEIPSSVESLGDHAFYNCDSLLSATINSKNIGASAFYDCARLISVELNEGVTDIGSNAFRYCYALDEIVIPSTVTSIGNYAFAYCKALTYIEILSGSIGEYAFQSCEKANKIILESGITSIGKGAFSSSGQIDEIYYNVPNATIESGFGDISYNLTIGKDVDILPTNFNAISDGINEVEFVGENIIVIEEDAFNSETLKVSDSVAGSLYGLSGEIYVGDNGVMYRLDKDNKTADLIYCPDEITELIVPEALVIDLNDSDGAYIGTYTIDGVESFALSMADHLKKLTFNTPENIKNISDYAFAYCSTLISVNEMTRVNDVPGVFSEGTSIGTDILVYTGLFGGVTEDSFNKEDPTGSQNAGDKIDISSININVSTPDDYSEVAGQWIEGDNGCYYDLLTGVPASINVSFDPGGTQDTYEYRVYIESTQNDSYIGGFVPGKTITFTNNNTGDSVDVTCYETNVPGVLCLIAENFDPSKTLNFSFDMYYPSPSSDGGGVRMWAALVPTEDDTEKAEGTVIEYISPSEKENSIQLWWKTIPNQFELTKSLTTDTKKVLLVGDGKGGVTLSDSLDYSISLKLSGSSAKYGVDPIRWIELSDILKLPAGFSWSQEVLEAVDSGDYQWVRKSNWIYITAGEKTIATFYISGVDSPVFSNFKLINNNGELTLSGRVEATDDMGTVGFSTINFNYYKSAIEVDFDKYEATDNHVSDNWVYVTFEYSYSDQLYLEANVEFELNTIDGALALYKKQTANSYSYEPYSRPNTYTLTVSNTAVGQYDVAANVVNPSDGLLADELDKLYKITPEDMETMLRETYGKTLTISISKATLCTDNAHMSTVTDAYGNTAYITGENSNLEYGVHDLTIYWEEDDIVVLVDDTDRYVVASTLRETLDELNYIVIDEDTQFSLSWDMTKTNNGIIYGGESRKYYIYATMKDTFERGTGDDPGAYAVSYAYPENRATADFGEIIKSAYVNRANYNREAYINKELNVNGVKYGSEEFILSNNDILDYTLVFNSHNYKIPYGYRNIIYNNLPIVDTLSGAQNLLVPVLKNESLADEGVKILSIDDISYYQLSEQGIYNDVFVGYDENGNLLIAEEIDVGETGTTVKWYFSNTGDKTITYKSIVNVSYTEGNEYSIGNTVWANDRVDNRIYASIPGITVNLMQADKEIYDRITKESLGDYCIVKEDVSISYRLTLESVVSNKYVLNGKDIFDVLPDTYGKFKWEKDVNVYLEFDESMTGVSAKGFEDWQIKQDEETGEYIIYWPETSEFTFETSNTAYIYVDLKFPAGDDWAAYSAVATGTMLVNTLHVYSLEFPVYHELSVMGEVYLQKGVYDVYRREGSYPNETTCYGDRNIYTNTIETYDEYVRYYVVVYNSGKARMYLSTIYDYLPDGFYCRFYRNNIYCYSSSVPAKILGENVVYKNAVIKPTDSDANGVVTFEIISGLSYDSRMGMHYLDEGEAVAFSYLCSVGNRDKTEDIATNTIRMEYIDYLNAGVKVSDTSATHNSTSKCTGTNDGDCRIVEGNILESSVSLERGEIVPGIIKSVESCTNINGDVFAYTGSVSNNTIINWKVRMENTGSDSIGEYTFTDVMEAPYTFVTGDDKYATIEIYSSTGRTKYMGKGLIPLTDDARQDGGTDVTFAVKAFPLSDGRAWGVGTAIAHVEITKDDKGNEVLKVDFSSACTSIPAFGYMDIYLSTENKTSNSYNKMFVNKSTLTPHDTQFSNVSHGIPGTDDNGEYADVTSYAFVNVIYGYATSSIKEVYEISNPENGTTSEANINYITLNSRSNQFRYTLNVGAPDDLPMDKLVFIDSLPNVGDHSPYDTEVYRGSEYKVSLATDAEGNINPEFVVEIEYADGTVTDLSSEQYKIEYSDETVFTEEDRKGTKSEGWYSVPTEKTRSMRIMIDGTSGLMPVKSSISVSFNAKVDDENAKPGDIAWNNFGYYYEVTPTGGSTISMEAMPLNVGIKIPSLPVLQKKLVYQEGIEPYVSEKDETFTFLIHKGEALASYENLTSDMFAGLDATIKTVTVEAGESVSEKIVLENAKLWQLDASGQWTDTGVDLIWESGAQYTVVELSSDSFNFRRLVGQKNNKYTFTYNPDVERTFVCENSPKKWEINLTKVDGLDNTLLLEGAGFALYSKDASEGVEVPDGLTDKLSQQIEVNGENWYFVKTGETDANGKLKFNDITSDVYYLYEYQTPKGYISKTQGQNIYYSDTEKGSISLTVENLYGVLLAKTGGMGVPQLMAVGLSLVIGSAVMLMLKKRKKSEQ